MMIRLLQPPTLLLLLLLPCRCIVAEAAPAVEALMILKQLQQQEAFLRQVQTHLHPLLHLPQPPAVLILQHSLHLLLRLLVLLLPPLSSILMAVLRAPNQLLAPSLLLWYQVTASPYRLRPIC